MASETAPSFGLGSSLPGEVSVVDCAEGQGDEPGQKDTNSESKVHNSNGSENNEYSDFSNQNDNNDKINDDNNNNATFVGRKLPSSKTKKTARKDSSGTRNRLGFVW